MFKLFSRIVLIICVVSWGGFMLATCLSYEGDKIYYLIFSALYASLLLSGVIRPFCFSYLFLSVMLFLGFWVKFSYHQLFHLPYQEPVGAFVATPKAWDHVLVIASVGCLGVLLAQWIYRKWIRSSTIYMDVPTLSIVPVWYQRYRKFILIGINLCMVIGFFLNHYLNIFVVGVVPKTILFWPMNAVICWLLSIGFALMISTSLWWELHMKRSMFSGYVTQLSEGFFMSCAILSRALYMFHVIPIALVCYLHRQLGDPIEKKKIIQLGLLSVILFFASLQAVSILRVHYHDGLKWASIDVKAPFFIRVFNQLVVDRWLGMEGVMAVSAAPNLGFNLFKQGLLEKSEIGKVDVYQKIRTIVYQTINQALHALNLF